MLINNQSTMRIKYILCFCLFSFFALKAQSIVESPDGKLKVSVSLNNGRPFYSVAYNGKPFLENSPLGLKTNVGDFASGLALEDKVNQTKIDATYDLANIQQSKVQYVSNEDVFLFTTVGNKPQC